MLLYRIEVIPLIVMSNRCYNPFMAEKYSFYNNPDIKLADEAAWNSPKELFTDLTSLVAKALGIEPADLQLEHPLEKSHGDYSTSIALRKSGGTNPREKAAELQKKLETDTEAGKMIAKTDIAGPGFLNIYLKPEVTAEYINKFAAKQFSAKKPLDGKRIMFEYAHPNPFKSFHIGHLRNIILGESLVRILEEQGAEVIRVNYQGDVGMHIAKCLWALKKVDQKDFPQDTTERVKLLGKAYAEGAAKFEQDEAIKEEIKTINKQIYSGEDKQIAELWSMGKEWSLAKFKELYERVYSSFVREYMESETLERSAKAIAEAKGKGILKESQGALIFDGSEYGLDTRVFQNSRGLPTYEGKELGLAYMEFSDYGELDLCIHNVAVEQISFFKVTFKAEELLDAEMFKGKQYHNAYEFVGLKSGKMSSRKGNVVLGEDILNEARNEILKIVSSREEMDESEKQNAADVISVGAVKYSFLNISPGTYLAFDLEKSLSFDGNSGPYLQYTYARARKILKEFGKELPEVTGLAEKLTEQEETDLYSYLYRFQEATTESAKSLSPNILCTYLFELAQKFNLFYKKVNVLKETDEQKKFSRLLLISAVANVLGKGLGLLGIKSLERM